MCIRDRSSSAASGTHPSRASTPSTAARISAGSVGSTAATSSGLVRTWTPSSRAAQVAAADVPVDALASTRSARTGKFRMAWRTAGCVCAWSSPDTSRASPSSEGSDASASGSWERSEASPNRGYR